MRPTTTNPTTCNGCKPRSTTCAPDGSIAWTATIITQRTNIKLLLRESPSLTPSLPEALAASYPRARQEAADDTGLPLSTFPDQPPFALDQVLDEDYWPEPGEER